ncbi:MAG: DUF2628 domain-containing protein [Nitrospira sp.]|nr:DUF2628 domain-containing protein [Nitrospira sp.]
MKVCTRCDRQQADDANFCAHCGAPLNPSSPSSSPSSSSSAEAQTEPAGWWGGGGARSDILLWEHFIGPHADHYLQVFKKFSSDGRPRFALSWNWPAFLFSFLWFLYRKMYLHAFVYAVGPVASVYLTHDPFTSLVWGVMAGATGHYLYYWHCREQIENIQKMEGMTPTAREAALKDAGGVQPYVIWVGVALYIFYFISMAKMVQEGVPDREGRPVKQVETMPMGEEKLFGRVGRFFHL